jgi:hypothetical protein
MPESSVYVQLKLQNVWDAVNTNGGLPIGSGTLAVCDLDPKSLDFCREI